MAKLDGRHALVTGGGTGIGLGITQVLLRDGACVTIAARREEVLAESVARGDNLDLLVNNAGSGIPGVLMNIDASGWRSCSDINLVGPALYMKHAALRMKEPGEETIESLGVEDHRRVPKKWSEERHGSSASPGERR